MGIPSDNVNIAIICILKQVIYHINFIITKQVLKPEMPYLNPQFPSPLTFCFRNSHPENFSPVIKKFGQRSVWDFSQVHILSEKETFRCESLIYFVKLFQQLGRCRVEHRRLEHVRHSITTLRKTKNTSFTSSFWNQEGVKVKMH